MTCLRWLRRVMWLLLLVLLTGCDKMVEVRLVEESPTGAVVVVTSTSAGVVDETALPVPSATPTRAAPTAAPPSPTPTLLPPSPQPLAPTSTPRLDAIRIQFQPGATGASLTGTSTPGRVDRYVLRAQAGQMMQASVLSPGDAVVLSIAGADGVSLVQPAEGLTAWRGRLPATQDYVLHAIPVSGEADYELRVDIAARIEFDAGATSATRQGYVGPHGMGWYVLRAIAGQTMEVEISSPGDRVLLTIVGEDGIPLKRYVDGETWWQGELLSTQDYYLQAESFGEATKYTLRVNISPLHLPEPERIEFAPGATSATVEGTLEPGSAHRYRLRALAGQQMEVQVLPADGVDIAVAGEDGAFWSALPWEGSLIIGSLPKTQDYTIILGRVPPAGTTPYTLVVRIPPP